MANWQYYHDMFLNSIDKLIIIVIIMFISFLASRFFAFLLDRAFQRSSKHLKVDATKYRFLKHALSAVIYIIGISVSIYTIPAFRTLAVSIFAGAGILAVIVGFASQQAFSNLVSGVFLVIFKPFKVGERIKIGTDAGVVEDITLRHTIIRNFENKRLIIPNSVISNETIENWDSQDTKICRWVEIGISYDSDIDRAIKIMQEEAVKHPNYIDNRTKEEKEDGRPEVGVRVIGFGDSSVNLRAYVWAKDSAEAFIMGCDLNKSIKERFDRGGIEIPFPYRTLVYKTNVQKETDKIKKTIEKIEGKAKNKNKIKLKKTQKGTRK